jgi:hypothetical protein
MISTSGPSISKPVLLAGLCAVVSARGLVGRHSGLQRVLADEVPVAHPPRAEVAEVADGAVVAEAPASASCVAAPSETGIGLREGELRRE